MPRNLSPAMLTALQSGILYPAIFVNLGFASGTAYIWSGIGNCTWNGNTYVGVGDLGQISVIEEGATVEAKGISLTLSGIDSTMLADALQESQLGLPATIYLALYTGPGGTIIADPLTAWSGFTDQPEIVLTGPTAEITLRLESVLLELNKPVDRRYTLQDQQVQAPGDIAFQFVPSLQEISFVWNGQATKTNNI